MTPEQLKSAEAELTLQRKTVLADHVRDLLAYVKELQEKLLKAKDSWLELEMDITFLKEELEKLEHPPKVYFQRAADDLTMSASPPGAKIECYFMGDYSKVRIIDTRGDSLHVAYVDVFPMGNSLTQETIDIASALYWSWWRACCMKKEEPKGFQT